METYVLNDQRKTELIRRLAQAIDTYEGNIAEKLYAAAEVVGILIVGTSETPVSGYQVAVELENHIKNTMIAGFSAKGFNMGTQIVGG